MSSRLGIPGFLNPLNTTFSQPRCLMRLMSDACRYRSKLGPNGFYRSIRRFAWRLYVVSIMLCLLTFKFAPHPTFRYLLCDGRNLRSATSPHQTKDCERLPDVIYSSCLPPLFPSVRLRRPRILLYHSNILLGINIRHE
jgi:hypothetical protein